MHRQSSSSGWWWWWNNVWVVCFMAHRDIQHSEGIINKSGEGMAHADEVAARIINL